jgi:hypothetical protein
VDDWPWFENRGARPRLIEEALETTSWNRSRRMRTCRLRRVRCSRAARRAREIARQTNTPIVIVRDGVLVEEMVTDEDLDAFDVEAGGTGVPERAMCAKRRSGLRPVNGVSGVVSHAMRDARFSLPQQGGGAGRRRTSRRGAGGPLVRETACRFRKFWPRSAAVQA